MATSGYATDNSIYIDQSGDNSTINITQDGAGNGVNGLLTSGAASTNPQDNARLYGNNQQVTIQQTGPNNKLSLGLQTTVGSNGKGITLNYDVSSGEGNNVAVINSNNNGQNTSAGNNIDVTQAGGYANLNVNMLGNTNSLVALQSGGTHNSLTALINADNVVANVNQTGGGSNATTLNLTGDKGLVNITTTGASNITNVTQSGGSSNGNQVNYTADGTGNTLNVTQAGLFDNTANVTLHGSNNNNNISISQSGGNSIGQYASVDLAVNSSSNTIGITQQGSADNLTNLKVNGSHNNYTILQKH